MPADLTSTAPSSTRAGVDISPSRPLISVVIVSWKVRDLLDRCLQKLARGGDRERLEIIVVDNDSQDGTLAMLRDKHPDVVAIDAGRNLGFSSGNNLAVERATAPFVLLLNPDTEVSPGAVDQLAEVLETSTDVGIVGPMVQLPSGEIQLACARRFPTLWNQALEILGLAHKFPNSRIFGTWRMGYWNHMEELDVEAISGSCLLIRKSLLDRLGGLDETFFMYGEDLDLCWRVRKLGFRIRYHPAARILHLSGQSSAQDERRMFVETHESMYRLLLKSRGHSYAVLYRLIVLVVCAAWIAAETCRAALAREQMKAHLRTEVIPRYQAIIGWALRGSSLSKTPSPSRPGVPESRHGANGSGSYPMEP